MTLRISAGVFLALLFAVPLVSQAALDMSADSIDCRPDATPKGCPPCSKQKMWKNGCESDPAQTKWGCPCKSQVVPAGGLCVATNNCQGNWFKDQQGKTQSPGDSKGFMDALKGVMDLLKQAMQKDQQQQHQPQTGTQGCTTYHQVSTPTTDPCAYYVPPTSDSLLTNTTGNIGTGVSDALLDALSGGTNINVSDQLLGAINPQPSGTLPPLPSPTPADTAPPPAGGTLATQAVNLQAGAQGNIEITPGGVTVIARSRDTQANTEIAGFYGSPTIGGEQPQGLVARLCKSRPWATSFVTYLIPPSFFDSLCAWRGYQVGTPTPPPSPVVVQQVRQTPPPPVSSTSTVSAITPEVDIWAVPARVPLGTRTSVFWNTKGVDSCTISSPDGSFEEHAISGGAATVPLTGATTFTISCLAPSGQPVTDYVTVGLSI